MTLPIPPLLFDSDSEAGALACVLDPDGGTLLLDCLELYFFQDERHRAIFSALLVMKEKGNAFDVIALRDSLESSGALDEAGGLCYVGSLPEKREHVRMFRSYREILEKYAAKRETYRIGEEFRQTAVSPTFSMDSVNAVVEVGVARLSSFLPAGKSSSLTVWSPAELQSYEPDPMQLLVGDCGVYQGAVVVIGGAAGVGKSRAASWLALAGATGESWFGLPVHRQFRTLILQNENWKRRLAKEAKSWPQGCNDWIRVSQPPDGGMNFHDPRFCRELRRIIAEFKPDVIVLDPWNSVAHEDKQADYLKALEALKQIIGSGEEAPALVIVAHTRKPSGENRASGRGLLHELSGSHVLGSRARTVYVIEAMSSNVDDDRIIFQCVKANDGQMPPKSFWHRRNGAFLPCLDIAESDVKERGRKPSKAITLEQVRTIFLNASGPLSRKEAVNALKKSTPFGRTAAFEALKPGGRYSDHLAVDEDGKLSWKD